MQEPVTHQAQTRPQRRGETVAHIVLAVSRHRHVDGDDERLKAGLGDTLEQGRDIVAVWRNVGLKPGCAVCGANALHCRKRCAAENIGDVSLGGGGRQSKIGSEVQESGAAHGRDAEGGGIGTPQQVSDGGSGERRR